MEEMYREMYVVVTDYVKANTGEDVSDALQELILANPNKTIFFPDGEYLLSKPICTPANPVNAVSLKLATFAKLKAMDSWTEKEAVVRLGAAEPYNSIYIPGSNYYFEGGIIDGNGKANGISIDSGRETAIHHVSIKNTEIGIHIKWGANNRSSDADVHSVNIVGNHSKTSIGVLLEGHDNTLTNMRIAGVHVGIQADSGGNIFRNLHPLYIYAGENAEDENFLTSVAFMDRWNDNYYDICYSDQFCTAFSMQSSSRNIYTNSYIMWYTSRGGVENAFKVNGKFNSVIRTPRVNFHHDTTNALLSVTEENGSGIIENPMINNEDHITDKTYKEYLTGIVVTPKK
ncbi:MAG: hypothetical protein E7642_03735 [Ruminococcaceae bacterium]|nr:hypothetical protein [Oscillospiraceae bacterium]